MTISMNHPKAMLECMYPSSLFLFQSFTWKRQSQKMSLIFFAMVLGLTRDMKNLFRSSLGNWSIMRTSPIRQYDRMNIIPIMNGSTKSLYPVRNRSLTSVLLI